MLDYSCIDLQIIHLPPYFRFLAGPTASSPQMTASVVFWDGLNKKELILLNDKKTRRGLLQVLTL